MAQYARQSDSGTTIYGLPVSPLIGTIAVDSVDGKLKKYNGTGWDLVGGELDTNILAIINSENGAISDFTNTNLEIISSSPIHGTKSYRLQHAAASTNSFKKILAVDSKFRGKGISLEVDVMSSANTSNLTLLVYDETNATNIAASQQVGTGSFSITATVSITSNQLTAMNNIDFNQLKVGMAITGPGIPLGTKISAVSVSTLTATISANATSSSTSSKSVSSLTTRKTFSFLIPESCASMSFTFSALQEANTPESYFDDIRLLIAQYALTNASITVPVSVLNVMGSVISSTGTITTQDAPFIQSITKNGTGDYTITFIVGKFTVAPVVVLTPMLTGGATGFVSIVNSVTTSGFRFRSNADSPGGSTTPVLTDMEVHVSVSKQGIDYTNPLTATTSTTIPLTTAQLVQISDSCLQMNNFSYGLGSVGTQILTFGTPVYQSMIGDAILYVKDAVNGDYFQAQRDGNYTFNLSMDHVNNVNGGWGYSKNSTQLTTSIASINDSDKLAMIYGTDVTTGGWQGLLKTGDKFRVHNMNLGTVGVTPYMTLSMSYQGSLKQLNPSTDSKITIPTHQLRFEGSSAKGSADTNIIKFDNQTITQGDAFDVLNTVANGTVVTMKKAGTLDLSASIYGGTASMLFLSRNQAILTADPVTSERLSYDGNQGGNEGGGTSWSGQVNIGDKIRATFQGTPNNAHPGLFTFFLTETSIPANFSNVLPQWSQSDSCIQLRTANGYGSTNTKIRRFSNTIQSLGSDIVYIDDAALGGYFTIKTDGTYTISYSDSFTGATNIGISKNTTQPTTPIVSLTNQAECLQIMTTVNTTGYAGSATISVYLIAGDIIRAHTDGVATGVSAMDAKFTISKVGKPNLTSVDVTPFVNLKLPDTNIVGEVVAYAGSSIPDNFLDCDGSAKSRTTYADLFNVIGVTHGQGDGSTTFNVPDYRGRFLRGVDGAVTNDPDHASRTAMNTGGNTGNSVGSVQGDINKSHTHTQDAHNHTQNSHNHTQDAHNHTQNAHTHTESASAGWTASGYGPGTGGNTVYTAFTTGATTATNIAATATNQVSTATNIAATATNQVDGGTETRPKNAYVRYIIRYMPNQTGIATPTQQVSSDTIPFVFKATAIDPAVDAIGTFNTYTYGASSNTATIGATAPTQTTSSMNINGVQIFARAYNAASTTASPARVDIFIGKGLKSKQVDAYSALAKVTQLSYDLVQYNSSALYGSTAQYSELTGILIIESAVCALTSTTARQVGFDASAGAPANGYFVFNASKSPSLVTIPNATQRIAYLSEQQASGTAQAGNTGGAHNTKVLNTIVDNTGIITSLASNQFILPAGTYDFDANAAQYKADGGRLRIRNITDATTAILGTQIYNTAAANVVSFIGLKGTVTITSTKTFELQHWVTTTITPGGIQLSNGESEVYTTLKITKIK